MKIFIKRLVWGLHKRYTSDTFRACTTRADNAQKEIKMKNIYKAYLYEEPCGRFMGEIDGVYINTNISEIQNTPIEFYADSKQSLLSEMVKFLKGTGRTGVLRVVN